MITLEEIYELDLRPGDRLDVKIKDEDGIIPHYRGKTLLCSFKRFAGELIEREGKDWTLLQANAYPYLPSQLVYGFHVWLIDDVTVLHRAAR